MEDKDLGSKKINNKQSDAEVVSNNYEKSANKPLKLEIEAVKSGDKKVVERARNANHDHEVSETVIDKNVSSKPSTASEELGKKMVENQDKNSDITPNRKTE